MSYVPIRAPRHERLSIRALQHRLTWWGAPSAAPLVLLHGYMDCGDSWQFLVDCLPESWSCVAPDWRGFGGSDWAPGGYWFPDYLADLESLLEALVPAGRARVIGHSMGANIAMLYAGIRPARLEWLVNLEGLGLRPAAPELAPARYAQWLDELKAPLRQGQYRSIAQLAAVLRQRNPRLTAARAQFMARVWSRSDGEGGLRLAFDPRHRLVNPVLYRFEEAEACWARAATPMLLLVGAESAHLSRRGGDAGYHHLQSGYRDLRVVSVPGVGHMMHHEDPQAVAEQIIAFERTQR